MRVLVVEDDQGQRDYFTDQLERAGCECLVARDGEEALRLVLEEDLDLVLLDVELPKLDGIEVLRKLREKDRDTIVVIATVYRDQATTIKALQFGANDFYVKPVTYATIQGIITKYRPIVAARRMPTLLPEFVIRRECDIEIGNQVDKVAAVAEYLTKEGEMARTRQLATSCTLGLCELIANAIEHGNLGITGTEKSQALSQRGDAWGNLWRTRAAEPARANRRVRIHMESTREYTEYVIEDEGDGFDWQLVLERFEDLEALAQHGRGIYLAWLQFDELEYNATGNSVRVRKYKR